MSDLVERLRDVRSLGFVPGAMPVELCQEAASEIERLRAEVEALVEAAGPFVALLGRIEPLHHDATPLHGDNPPTVGDLRALSRAVEAAALRAEAGETE